MIQYTPGDLKVQEVPFGGGFDVVSYEGFPEHFVVNFDNKDDADLFAAAPETAAERDRLKVENAELVKGLVSIRDHYDMEGYGKDTWKILALEMADVARALLAKI